MIRLIIPVAQIIILLTRMIARICKNSRASTGNNILQGAAGGRGLFSQLCLVVLHIRAIILVIGMIIWAARMISPIILNHPR